MAPRVFVSYRRTDDRQAAGRLRDRLADAFGESDVFFDVDSIEYGQDFRTVIRSTIAAADAVVVVIGPRFDPGRLAEANDFVRLELLEAFKEQKLVLPVVTEGAVMPRADELPAELENLSYCNAAPLRPDPDFRTDVERLIQSLRRTVGDPSDASPPTQPHAATPSPGSQPRRAPQPASQSAVSVRDEDDRVYERTEPFEAQLLWLLRRSTEPDNGAFLVLERPDDPDHFAQVAIPWSGGDDSDGFTLEYRDGDRQYAAVTDSAEVAAHVLAGWADEIDGWQGQLTWELLEL